ncbi:MAG: thioredoxin family protein [Fusobacteriaceae bacterium]
MFSRIESLSKEYSGSEFYGLDIRKSPEVAGEFMVFITPVLIVYYEGMEIVRKIRFFPLYEIKETLDRFIEKIKVED